MAKNKVTMLKVYTMTFVVLAVFVIIATVIGAVVNGKM